MKSIDLTKQQSKVFDYILRNPGCTTRDIINATYVTCPSGRITEMRAMGVPIVSVGQKKYGGSKAFECYAIKPGMPVTQVDQKPIERPKQEQLALV